MELSPEQLKAELADEAGHLGFDALGVAAPLALTGEAARHQEWAGRGYAGDKAYLTRNIAGRYDPRSLLPECASVIVVAQSYYTAAPDWPRPGIARVARYAWGDDYHEVIRPRLEQLGRWLDERIAGHRWKATVDTSPLSEKALAVAAGIGWRGKHSMVLNDRLGSYFLIGCLLTSTQLPVDQPLSDGCGDCTLCVDACPVGALTEPRVLDASRCISFLNEHQRRAPAPGAKLAGWLYGCDECQQVCPYNATPLSTREPRLIPRPGILDLTAAEVLAMTPPQFEQRFQGTVIAEHGLEALQAMARCL